MDWNPLFMYSGLICSLVIFCEFLIYYLVIYQCSWPSIPNENKENEITTLKALLLADTHLLGPYRGHWFDKLRREWQMHRAFQTAISLYQPEVIFILGDLFDEGQWSNEVQFQEYVTRFYSLFKVPEPTKIYVVPGNHDIGFHYVLNSYLVNSMAMEGDGCYFCLKAKRKILDISAKLNLSKVKDKHKKEATDNLFNTRPIILQHFPLYRKSDSVCNETDEAPSQLKNQLFREKWDCLSKEASTMIKEKLNPRLIISGHVHHGCHVLHENDIHEYTLSSFSWRNKNNPTFILAKLNPNSFILKKCDLPKESTVICVYIFTITGSIFYYIICKLNFLSFITSRFTSI